MPKVIITGSGRRLGRSLALGFASKDWDIVVHYNESAAEAENTCAEVRSTGVQALLVKADVRNSNEVKAMFDSLADGSGFPDVLINNAGILPPLTPLTETDDLMWDNVFNTNLRGQFYCAREFARFAVAGSRIINISSLGGLEVWKNRLTYNVSKSAVIHMTKALARELAPDISVNCICPGEIVIPGEPAEFPSHIAAERIPMKRHGTPGDVFDAAWFFATASPWITGQVLAVDGGYHDAG